MRVIPAQWGNSIGIRLPKEIVQQVGVEKGVPLEITMEGRKIVIAPPKRKRRYTIEQLMENVTPEAMREAAAEVDWGPDVGREIIDD